MQTKRGSLIEAVVNTFLGWLVGLLSQLIVFPMLGIDIPFYKNLEISAIFTVISIVRGYVIRRVGTRFIK